MVNEERPPALPYGCLATLVAIGLAALVLALITASVR